MSAPVVFYTAVHGMIWSAANNFRTVAEAEEAAPKLLHMALTERHEALAATWMRQLADLVSAIREARLQIAAAAELSEAA